MAVSMLIHSIIFSIIGGRLKLLHVVRKYSFIQVEEIFIVFVFFFYPGNKLLSVALKQANIFLVTKSAAYNWDLCAAHAILRSIGGQIIDLRKIISYYEQNHTIDRVDFSQFEIIYNNLKSDRFQPKDYACQPFIAFYRSSDLIDILQVFVVNKIFIE